MAKQSGMIAFAEQFAQAKVDAAQRLTSQYMIDTLQMTIHQTKGWGYERIMRLTEAWQQTQKEYTPALNSNDPAADVMQEHMDRVMGGLSLGELTTLKTGEKPSETAVQEMLSVWGPHSIAEESRLSQILEANPLSKYNLTAKACLGLLRRAERRGKDLPERLKAVLLMQSASGGAVTEEEKAR